MSEEDSFVAPISRMTSNLQSTVEGLRRAQAKKTAFEHGFAQVMYEELMREIGDFEKTLDTDEEIGAYLSSFGQRILIQIDKVDYANPYLIIFDGINAESNAKVRLVQHTSQISVLFAAIKVKPEEDRKPKRIGIGFMPSED